MSPHEMPPITDETQIIAEMERDFAADALIVGDVALLSDVDTSYIEAGINAAADHANNGSTDQRVHSVDAAFDMALQENEIFNAHAEALAQNEIFDAHVEALHQNEIFDAHTAALKEDEERAEQQQADEEQQVQILQEEKQQAETDNRHLITTNSDYRKQAEAALKQAGYKESVSLDSRVQKDLSTGNLMIISGNDVKVVEPRLGGQPQITEYTYDEDKKVLTVRAAGNTITTARVGDFVETDANNWQQYGDVITLPPAVASAIGIEKVIPIVQT